MQEGMDIADDPKGGPSCSLFRICILDKPMFIQAYAVIHYIFPTAEYVLIYSFLQKKKIADGPYPITCAAAVTAMPSY